MTGPELIALYGKHLRSIERWIDKAKAYAAVREFDADVLVGARLAPDQFSFARQVQVACDTAKLAASKLAGVEPPSHADTVTTLDDLKDRMRTCLSYLESLRPEQFAGCEERQCSHVWMGSKWMRGADYIRQYAVPNFLFHVTTVYAILRHNGVPLGKSDFLRPLSLQG